ncbi:hypothetical protein SDC9_193321 [bioreactor metagenome]|uniref:Uncharacterized protein n=1 Tax=bioreactor metagenome TaxID=1076179 RepID=A0A645I3Q5_9ZZZZ
MAEVFREFDLPAGLLQVQRALLHEGHPMHFVGQAIDAFGRAAEGVQGMARNLLQAAAGQRFQRLRFGLRAALQADRLAFRQGDELAFLFGPDVGVAIAENDLGDIELTAGEILRIAPPGAVAMRMQGFELQDGNQRRVDEAQAGAGIAAR